MVLEGCRGAIKEGRQQAAALLQHPRDMPQLQLPLPHDMSPMRAALRELPA